MKKFFSLLLLCVFSGIVFAGNTFEHQMNVNVKRFSIHRSGKGKKKSPIVPQKIDARVAGKYTVAQASSMATSLQWPFSTKLTAPGTLIVTLDDKSTGKISNINWKVNFNLPKRGNGSAGNQTVKYPADAKWKSRRLEITVPGNTTSMQFIVAPVGTNGAEWSFSNLKLAYAPDTIKIAKFTPQADIAPSKWQDIDRADCFFNRHTGLAAEVQTSAKVCYDDKNLYIGYICFEPDMSILKGKLTRRDSNLWEDDCIEVFFFDPVADVVKQFIVNPLNTQFDCERRQAQEGDPYRVKPWDGKWSSKVWKNSDSWEVLLTIPWQTLGFKTVPQHKVTLNIARERAADNGKYMWNCYQGSFGEVDKFAELDLQKGTLTRSRKVEKINYLPKRARKVYKEVLTDIKKDWKCDMSSGDFMLVYQPPAIKKKYNLQSWKSWQKKYLNYHGEAGILGPVYPWVMHKRNTDITLDEFYEIHKKTGLTFPAHIDPSPARAHKMGAMPTFYSPPGRIRVDSSDPAAIKSMCMSIDELAQKFAENPKLKEMISFLEGVDEPANLVAKMYSHTQNPEMKAYLDKLSEKIKTEYGFGKFALPDHYAPLTEDFSFERIAFWRWWNDRYAKHTKTVFEYAKEKLGLETFVLCRNNCGAIDEIDVALVADGKIVAGCDPYPTSAKSQLSMARAMYHTGFCTKLFRDLAPQATVVSYGQAFNYHGGAPTRAELREWVSQALKTGADYLRWYGGGALNQNPELFNEAFEISYQLQNSVPKLKLPSETVTGIYYSDYDRWGLGDRAAHAPYTVYSLLGEQNAMWFRFVSKHKMDLDGIKLLYIPRMRFTDPAITAKLVDYVRNGGTLVVLDPDFMTWNIDKTPVPEREQLIGTKLVKKNLTLPRLRYGRETLPLSKVTHLQLPENGSLHAYDFAGLPAGAKVLAEYADGKPAIIERAFGKGKVIFSAALAFGSSDAATAPQGWKKFTADLGKQAGEKDNQDIWFFELPEVKNKRFKIKYPY